MVADLIVGPLDSHVRDHVLKICQRIGLRDWPSTDSQPSRNSQTAPSGVQLLADCRMISVINGASLDAFNTFAARLEGLSELDAMDNTAFRNLPWWLQSFWLPVEFDPPRELASDKDDPTFVGSSIRLLNELAKIREMSPLDLSTSPPTYRAMRNDYRGWFARPQNLSEDDTIRWVWNALRDGAQISIESKFPMMLAP